jgi:inorganic pyrophosphatase
MSEGKTDPMWALMGLLFKGHPWHGVPIGDDAPNVLTTYIEIVPTDTIKYELDKVLGHLKVDRPQKFSNLCPTLYGLVPQTYCSTRVAEFCEERTGREGIIGDADPLDICVLSEKSISHGDILLRAIPIGGLRMIDENEADDKIIAVMEGDAVYGEWTDIDRCPSKLVDRLVHYFLTYKDVPGNEQRSCEITHVYGRDEAFEVIRRANEDYLAQFEGIEGMLTAALRGVCEEVFHNQQDGVR